MQEKQYLDILYEFDQKEMAETFSAMNDTDRERILKQADMMDFSGLKYASGDSAETGRGTITPIRTMKRDEIEVKAEHFRKGKTETIIRRKNRTETSPVVICPKDRTAHHLKCQAAIMEKDRKCRTANK